MANQLSVPAPQTPDTTEHPVVRPRGRRLATLSLAALGIVFGDIGTSPLYAFRECLHGRHAVAPAPDNVLGVLSLIFWSLVLVISLKYLGYVLRADNQGEGGILALMALAMRRLPDTSMRRRSVVLLGLVGAALLYGDGMITPAISVLSAVEGLEIASPHLTALVVPITIAILVGLFAVQRHGTARVGSLFGPITFAWFGAIAVLGIACIVRAPAVLAALNPTHALGFLSRNGLGGLLVLGAVFLVVTGGEALYADMGHFGARPIRLMWFSVVFPALVLNYFGQGALLLERPEAAENPFYRMAPAWALLPMLVLSTLATIIASQALISGAFSLTRQAIMLGYFPRTRVEHTSAGEIGQIYVPGVNRLLMVCTIGLVLGFGSSSRLAAAYGIAVTLTMLITTLLAYVVARHYWGWSVPAAGAITLLLLVPDTAFFGANLAKIHDGGWFPLVMGAAVFTVFTTWKHGRGTVTAHHRDKLVPPEDLIELLRVERPARVPGMAVYLSSNPDFAPAALLYNFEYNRVVHRDVVMLTIVTDNVARVDPEWRVHVERLGEGFHRVIAHYGFMETPDVPELMESCKLSGYVPEHTTYFLGRETVLPTPGPGMALWREKLFAFLSRNAQPATAFFGIPPDRVIEIGTQVEI